MHEKSNKHCYKMLLNKVSSLDNQIARVKDQIEELKKLLLLEDAKNNNTTDGACMVEMATSLETNKEC